MQVPACKADKGEWRKKLYLFNLFGGFPSFLKRQESLLHCGVNIAMHNLQGCHAVLAL